MVETNDGFEIAEMDLQLRGAGDLQGTQQSGIPGLKIADLITDTNILQLARSAAVKMLKEDPHLEKEKHHILRNFLSEQKKKKGDWSRVSWGKTGMNIFPILLKHKFIFATEDNPNLNYSPH